VARSLAWEVERERGARRGASGAGAGSRRVRARVGTAWLKTAAARATPAQHSSALRAEIARQRAANGAQRIGLIGFSAGGHLAGLAALAPGAAPDGTVDFAVLGYAITSMETESYRPARLILLGEDASHPLRRSTSLDSLVTPQSPPFFVWHTAEDPYVPPEHTYRLATALAANNVPHAVHVFAHGTHSLGLAQNAGEAAVWTTLASAWIHEQASLSR
jgi:acetyl esterase/lipase